MEIKTHLELIAVEAANQNENSRTSTQSKKKKTNEKKNGFLKLAIENLNEREKVKKKRIYELD